MPMYAHKCVKCSRRVEEFRRAGDWQNAPMCPTCLIPMPQDFGQKVVEVRGNYKKPIRMESMGFVADPEDVAEHRRRFPDVDLEIHQGSAIPVIRSLGQKRAYLKAIGWVDSRSF
jgi:hypothetical protein